MKQTPARVQARSRRCGSRTAVASAVASSHRSARFHLGKHHIGRLTEVKVHEYFASPGSHVILSVHYGDFPPSLFPEDKGLVREYAGWAPSQFAQWAPSSTLHSSVACPVVAHFPQDPIIAGFVVMDIGSYAVYRGTYKGTDPIKIMATGSVRDLGKPPNANDAVTIGIRKNLTMYVFIADYGTDPVAAPFSELVDEGGHNYVPRFSPNFIIKQVQISLCVKNAWCRAIEA
ncbi:uncharacterized protein LOC142796276 isoform X2 [Rhipicephalus microplus]|uniref:uncharacterized protein LOC142796276 isoform X2 n=1 Tax=Rhipicephalus microplus TaxID=6941 RepID=UPI003F6CC98D